MASVAQIEASVVVMKGVTRASKPRGATVELDPHRGEDGKHAKLPQSFLLSKVVRTPSMFLHRLLNQQWGQRHRHHV
jgi:hypothetical protein